MVMSISASDVKNSTIELVKKAGNKSVEAARWCGHQISKIGSYVKSGFFKVINFARDFFRNIPTYLSNARIYMQQGIKYIKDNRTPVGVGAGLTVLIGSIIYLVYSYIKAPATTAC